MKKQEPVEPIGYLLEYNRRWLDGVVEHNIELFYKDSKGLDTQRKWVQIHPDIDFIKEEPIYSEATIKALQEQIAKKKRAVPSMADVLAHNFNTYVKPADDNSEQIINELKSQLKDQSGSFVDIIKEQEAEIARLESLMPSLLDDDMSDIPDIPDGHPIELYNEVDDRSMFFRKRPNTEAAKKLAKWVQRKIFSSSGRMFDSDEELEKIQKLVDEIGG